MSHFTLLVTGNDIEAQLAPYDENKQVEPYKEYEDGDPADHPSVPTSRAQNLLPADGDLTWQQVADARHQCYEITSPDDPEYLHVDDDGRAYQWSTYNQSAKWDWYSIGGRWGGYFPLVDSLLADPAAQRRYADAGQLLLPKRQHWTASEPVESGRVDGGLRAFLDLTLMRTEAATEAQTRWMDYNAYASKHGVEEAEERAPFVPWDQWMARVPDYRARTAAAAFVDLPDLTYDEARKGYHAQPRLVAFSLQEGRQRFGWGAEHEEYMVPLHVYVERARLGAVCPYAVLHQGEWIAPGRMGWFGMSSDGVEDRDLYHAKVSELIDGLPPETMLTLLDLHI